MDKKIIFLELPVDIINKIDQQNTTGTRSSFVTELLEQHLNTREEKIDLSPDVSTTMQTNNQEKTITEVSIVDSQGSQIGKFNIDTIDGFDALINQINQVSTDPNVRMKALQLQ